MIVEGARQVGKSFIIRYIATTVLKDKFKNYIEINFIEDSLGDKLFKNVNNKEDFYLSLSMKYGDKMKNKNNTLIFIDEIQEYPQFLTLLKFLKQDDRFTYIASGSLLGVTLIKTPSIPLGSIEIVNMYPLDFEEFLYAFNFNKEAIEFLHRKFLNQETLDEIMHNKLLDLFKKYLLIGGLPDTVNCYIHENNIFNVRQIQTDISNFYIDDASKYDKEHKLKTKRIYDLIPSNLKNKKKRIIYKDIDNKEGKRYSNYEDEFEYLISSNIALEVKAISNPTFPLIQSASKNLLKLYLNDVGLLSNELYKTNISAILNDIPSINLGSLYETVIASELVAHNHKLYYYDNKKNGEVDFLIDDYNNLSILPLEIKSGKDYYVHSALKNLLNNSSYSIKKGIVLSNERKVEEKNNIIYYPIYNIMFL